MNIEKVMWSILSATWCMILDNGAIENTTELAFEE